MPYTLAGSLKEHCSVMSSPATTYWLGAATIRFKSVEEGRESVDYILYVYQHMIRYVARLFEYKLSISD